MTLIKKQQEYIHEEKKQAQEALKIAKAQNKPVHIVSKRTSTCSEYIDTKTKIKPVKKTKRTWSESDYLDREYKTRSGRARTVEVLEMGKRSPILIKILFLNTGATRILNYESRGQAVDFSTIPKFDETKFLGRVYQSVHYGEYEITRIVKASKKVPAVVEVTFKNTKEKRITPYSNIVSHSQTLRDLSLPAPKRKRKVNPVDRKEYHLKYMKEYNKDYRETFRPMYNEYVRLNQNVNRVYKKFTQEIDNLKKEVLKRRLKKYYDEFYSFNDVSAEKLSEKLELNKIFGSFV